jgi:Domain of unknown function (DUF4262)
MVIERRVAESNGVPGCPCRICLPDDRSEWDELDFDNAETIAKHGWVVLAVDGEPGPGWSYTIGLTHTVGTPELMIFELSSTTRHFILNGIGEALRDGQLARSEGLVPPGVGSENLPFELKALSKEWGWDFGRVACWLNRNRESAFWQVVWTDREACFPWNRDFDDEFTDAQPFGWLPPPTPAESQWGRAYVASIWPTTGPANSLVFVSSSVQEGREPIRLVMHFEDGDWSFLDGIGPYDSDSMVLLHLEHVLERDPIVVDLIDLPVGFEAYREAVDQRWERQQTIDS